ncbi:MAG: SUF system NifU family Fe-S cluster assembly protein [Chloroflexi bacterium]|nr:SUF system NifU family Fe-S cluster assembly protein [Chloroflexota bacterium]
MSELRELYQEMVLDHNSKPRNFKEIEDATHTIEGYNPLCGDHITLYIKMRDDTIEDIGFQGTGCAISRASASMMTEQIEGMSKEEALELFHSFHGMVTGKSNGHVEEEDLGDLEVLAGIAEFPSRIKCATLAWHSLRSALGGKSEQVSTE